MSSNSDVLEMESPAPKQSVPKSSVTKAKNASKRTPAVIKKTGFKPSETKKTQFAPNTLIGFTNSYYRILGKNITFVRKNKKTTDKGHLIDPKACPSIAAVRHAYETVEKDQSINDLIMDPYVHTAYEFIEKAKKAKKEEKNIDGTFKALCRSFGIIENQNNELQTLIDNMCRFIKDNSKINGRIFNFVFGPVYAEKHPDKKDVHMRYIQRAPENLIDILHLKQANFKWTVDRFFDNSKTSLVHQYLPDESTDAGAVMEIVKMKTKNRDSHASLRAEITKLLGGSAKANEIASMQRSISHIRTCYNFINYLSEITDKKQFDALVNRVESLSEEFNECAVEVEKLQKKSIKAKDDKEVWGFLIAIVTRLASITNKLNSPTKNGKEKLPLTLLCTTLHKSGCNINIKNKSLRDAINKLATETYTDRAAFGIAREHQEAISQVVTPSAYNQFNPELYSKLGFILMEGWNYNKPVIKVSKSMRIALGMALFKYIDAEVAKLTYDKKAMKIIIDF